MKMWISLVAVFGHLFLIMLFYWCTAERVPHQHVLQQDMISRFSVVLTCFVDRMFSILCSFKKSCLLGC